MTYRNEIRRLAQWIKVARAYYIKGTALGINGFDKDENLAKTLTLSYEDNNSLVTFFLHSRAVMDGGLGFIANEEEADQFFQVNRPSWNKAVWWLLAFRNATHVDLHTIAELE